MGGGVIRVARARDAVRLVGEVYEVGAQTEPGRRHLAAELVRLLGCTVGAVVHDRGYLPGLKGGIVEATIVGFDAHNMMVFSAHHTEGADINPYHQAMMARSHEVERGEVVTSTDRDLVTRAAWDDSVWINDYARPARVAHFIGSVRFVDDRAVIGCGFMRAAGDRPFSAEDREVLHLVHVGVGTFFDATSQRVQLAPRVRQTLDELLTGATDKEIAQQLRLSSHTVRQYVKTILRAYGVSSRAQVIARALHSA